MADSRPSSAPPRRRKAKVRSTIGWREWIEFPDLSPHPIKAKIDTGARTSALHAFALHTHEVDGRTWVRFELHPIQRSAAGAVEVVLPVIAMRRVRSSNGKVESRPVVQTTVRLGDTQWPIEVTLTARDEMGFRMLLGRAAVRRRFLVDPGRSFLHGRGEKEMRG